MIQQATIRETLRYRRPNPGDAHRARTRLEREQRLIEGMRCGLGIGLGQGGPMQGLIGSPLNLASLLPGSYQVLQSDLGLTEGTTLLATVGSAATITFSGTRVGVPVPIWVKVTSGGARGVWTYAVYYDGLGTTAYQTGTSAATVALTGPGLGLTLNIGTGTTSTGDTWKATAAAYVDQSNNGHNFAQANSARQPGIGVGLNGKVELLFDGVDDFISNATVNPPANSLLYFIFRFLTTNGGFQYLCDGTTNNDRALIQWSSAAGDVSAYSGARLSGGTAPINSYIRVAAIFNGASSSIKVGSFSAVAGTVGPTSGAGRIIGAATGPAAAAAIGVFAMVWAPNISYAAADSALNLSGGYGAGAITV